MKEGNKYLEYFKAYVAELERLDMLEDRSMQEVFHSGWLCALDAFDSELEKTFMLPQDTNQFDGFVDQINNDVYKEINYENSTIHTEYDKSKTAEN